MSPQKSCVGRCKILQDEDLVKPSSLARSVRSFTVRFVKSCRTLEIVHSLEIVQRRACKIVYTVQYDLASYHWHGVHDLAPSKQSCKL